MRPITRATVPRALTRGHSRTVPAGCDDRRPTVACEHVHAGRLTMTRRESDPTFHRPRCRCPQPLAPLDDLVLQPALVLAPADARPVRVDRPGGCGPRRAATRSRCSARSRRRGSPRWPPTGTSCAGCDAPSATCAVLPASRAGTSPAARAGGRRCRARSPTSPRSSASPRRCRSTPAASASSPATTSRRPPTSACRSSASGCCTGTATSASRCPPTAGSRSATRPRPARPAAHPAARRRRRATRCRSASTCPTARMLHAQVWLAQVGPGAAAAARLRRRGERARAARRSPTGSTAAAPSTGCARRCCSASAASARCAPSARSPGTRSPRCSTPTRATPASSASSGSASYIGGRADLRRGARGRPGRHRVHHPHAGARRHRPVPARPDRAVLRRDAAGAALPLDRILALGAETYPGGDPHVFNMAVWACGWPSGPTASPSCTAQVSREMFDGLWPGFDAGEVPIGSITNGVHAPTWVAREISTSPSASAPTADADGGWRPSTRSRPRAVGDRAAAARPAGRRGPARGCASRGGSAAPPAAELGWIDDVLDPDVLTIGFARRVPSYKRLTLMLRDPERLQALLLDPERPVQFVIAGKAHPADDGGKQLIQQMVQFADDPSRAAPDRVPARLRHGDGPLPVPGLRRVAEQPAAPAGGLRHVRHEGRAQRRAEPVDPRRLVGRVVRRRERLGDPVRRRRRRPRPPRRPRGRRALRPDRQVGRAAVLRRGRRRHARAAGSRWCRHTCAASARSSRRTAWSATT